MSPLVRRPAVRRPQGRRLTVQGWVNVVLAVMGILVLGGAVTGAVLLNRTDDVSRELSENIQPSRVAAYQMQAAIRDQETAVRGYVIAGQRQFLTPYYVGQRAEQVAAADIRARVQDRPDLLADVDAITDATKQWRAEYGEPLIKAVTPGAPFVVNTEFADRSKADFDEIRALFDEQNRHLSNARQAGLDRLERLQGWRDTVLLSMVAAFFVTALLLAVLIRKAVTRPLEVLAAACRRNTEGDFDERIPARGPRDLRAIATDVENMRQRIVDDLAAARAAQLLLDEQAVDLRRSNAELEQFAYVASHDLQEPLRKVTAFCQLLEKRYGDKLDDRGVEYINFAVDGAKRMQVLINDLLTFSRVGRLNSTEIEVDLGAALDAALSNLSTAIEESGAQLVRPAELPKVQGDPTLLAMLWQNLIGNAVKFRRPGETPRLTIECEAATGPGDEGPEWLITLSDNGIGISEEFVEKVFVIFQRLHGRDAYSGTGIGLALCKKIVEFHGGTIWIDTDYTAGTRFRFTLPMPDTTSAASTPPHQPAAALERSPLMAYETRPIDVLLVEDDPGDELITREAFEHNKISNTLHVAHDGEEGLDFLYRRHPYENAPRPDLILLDLNLPKYDGRQLLERVKSDPQLSHIPVVVLTTSSAEEDILRSYKLHANAYVTKPVDLDQFMNAVRQIDEFFVQVVRLPQS